VTECSKCHYPYRQDAEVHIVDGRLCLLRQIHQLQIERQALQEENAELRQQLLDEKIENVQTMSKVNARLRNMLERMKERA